MNKERRIQGINLYGTFSAGQGYSGMTEQFAVAINRIAPVNVMRFNGAPDVNISKQAHDIIAQPFQVREVGITFGFPVAFDSMAFNKFKVGYTMFETDKLPSGEAWAGKGGNAATNINNWCDLLIVPCEHNRKLFIESGVTIPVEVVHNGLHPTGFPLMDRSKRKADHKFTFLIMGTLSIRKNSGAVISAFIQAFAGRDDVRLIVKTQSGTHGHMEFDKSLGDIEIIDGVYDEKQMRQLMKEADCFVFPTHGEGFGLPPIEAAATGLPTIIADNTGMSEYADPNYFLVVKSDEKAPAQRYPRHWGDVGNWYVPDFDELKEKMLWVFNNQQEAAAMGLRASKWVRENYDYRNLAQEMLDTIEKHMP